MRTSEMNNDLLLAAAQAAVDINSCASIPELAQKLQFEGDIHNLDTIMKASTKEAGEEGAAMWGYGFICGLTYRDMQSADE